MTRLNASRLRRHRIDPDQTAGDGSRARGRLKLIIGVLTIAPTLLLVFLLGHGVLGRASQAEADQALHEVPLLGEDAPYRATWLPAEWDGPRQPGTRTSKKLEAAYIRAWDAIGRYEQTGLTDGLERALAPAARAQLLSSTPARARATWLVSSNLRLTFFSLHGTTATIKDENAVVVRAMTAPDGTQTVQTQTHSYTAVIALDDGYWRVRQLREIDARGDVVTVQADAAAWTNARTDPVAAVRVLGVPEHTPVRISDLGPGVDLDVVPSRLGDLDAALAQAKEGGARRVRLPTAGLEPAQVVTALDHVVAHDLTATVVLDAAGTDRGVSTWAEATVRLRALLTAVGDHPAVVMWDLYDGPETAPTPPAQTAAWLIRAAGAVRAQNPGAAITISWAEPADALIADLAHRVDVVTISWSADGRRLPPWIVTATNRVSPRPIVVRQLIGDLNGWLPGEGGEAARRHRVQDVSAVAALAGAYLDLPRPGDVNP